MRVPALGIVVAVISWMTFSSLGLPRVTCARALPASDWPVSDVRLIQAGQAHPPLSALGAVCVVSRGKSRSDLGPWDSTFIAMAGRVRARGGDLLLSATVGEDASPGREGYVRWARGIAARAVPAPGDSLPDLADCVVEGAPAVSRGGDSTALAGDVQGTKRFFTEARVVLAARGYFLEDRADSSTWADLPDRAAHSGRRGALALQLEWSRRPGRNPGGDAGTYAALVGKLTWVVSGSVFWVGRTSWFEADSGSTGASAVSLRRSDAPISGLFLGLPPWSKPPDSDGDGVPDSRDVDPSTPRGTEVNREGVAIDDDGDGVPNGIDRDPHTRRGSLVDQWGVPIDSDHDGVDDNHDACPNTPAGLAVDGRGCPIAVAAMEDSLLDTGRITEQAIHFETGRAKLLRPSFARLDLVGQALSGMPELRFEIGGHCDDRGSDEVNQVLSEARAAAVLEYLVAKYPGLKREQFATRGYGKSRPRVVGNTEAARAKNRRVEFVILNPELARRQVQTKRFLNRGEAVPPDSTRR